MNPETENSVQILLSDRTRTVLPSPDPGNSDSYWPMIQEEYGPNKKNAWDEEREKKILEDTQKMDE